MFKLIINCLTTTLFVGCASLTYHSPTKKISSIMLLDPLSDIYAYINLSKNRFIYDDLNVKYKIGLNTVGNLYLSYTKNPESFASIITGNFPKNIYWGMQNNSNFESKGNIFTSPKWKIKNSNLYITPTKDKSGILINQKEIIQKNDNILTTKYIDILDQNEMFFWTRDITILMPNNVNRTNLIPFNGVILLVNSASDIDYSLKAYLKTSNPAVLSILSKKLIPTLLANITKLIVSSSIKSKIQDQDTVELEFTIEKISAKHFISSLILSNNYE
ncbi:hypothetical protein CR532_04380 [Candidatus Borreliella tachyglossi]|uniref:Lipoprotein n=1 Tax=Candidatus Borreliella tachyglossi TaxID=1964448 RepID=A0A2S1LXZ2_9SPIR|nr:hypothetical protein [Candidatus Borreliella tachyglossi]AWG43177.1 hypothetical protein CR532_04380 [Candidatus Borreliella tachyglossi]